MKIINTNKTAHCTICVHKSWAFWDSKAIFGTQRDLHSNVVHLLPDALFWANHFIFFWPLFPHAKNGDKSISDNLPRNL